MTLFTCCSCERSLSHDGPMPFADEGAVMCAQCLLDPGWHEREAAAAHPAAPAPRSDPAAVRRTFVAIAGGRQTAAAAPAFAVAIQVGAVPTTPTCAGAELLAANDVLRERFRILAGGGPPGLQDARANIVYVAANALLLLERFDQVVAQSTDAGGGDAA